MPRLEASRKAKRLVTAFEQSAGVDYHWQHMGTVEKARQARLNCESERGTLLRFIARLERQAARTELRAVINTVLGYLANADDDPTCFIENTLRKAL